GGILIDVQTDRIVTEDLSMPHSPRLNARVLWVLDSGRGYLCRVEEKSGKTERVAFCPGFAREPSFWRRHALVAHLASAQRRVQGPRAQGERKGARRRAALRRLYLRHSQRRHPALD